MRRNEDTTGFTAGRFCIFVDIGVNSTSDCTQTVMAVCKYTRHRELFQTACVSCLENADVGIVIHTHRIKLDFQMFHIV